MHVGIANRGGGENVHGIPDIPGACSTRNCTYLIRVPWLAYTSPTIKPDRWVCPTAVLLYTAFGHFASSLAFEPVPSSMQRAVTESAAGQAVQLVSHPAFWLADGNVTLAWLSTWTEWICGIWTTKMLMLNKFTVHSRYLAVTFTQLTHGRQP